MRNGNVCSNCVDEGDCLADEAACAFSDERCCGLCAADESGNPVCCPDGTTCVADGGTCTADADCCNYLCTDGVCGPGSVCVPLGAGCETDADCCSGYCDPTSNACSVIIA